MNSNSVKGKLKKIKGQIGEIENSKDIKALDKLEKKYLGRKAGEITSILKGLSKLSLREKQEIGVLANRVKSEIVSEINKRRSQLQKPEAELNIDVTLPTDKDKLGHLHPISKVQYELEDIFTSMGFMVLDGPELESDYFSFEALNIPKYHPARDMQDTFYISSIEDKGKHVALNGRSDLVLRPHTSPVQVRAMHKYGAPLRCVAPGRVFRCEATDAVHEHTFDQMEGLMIGENISIANLIAVMKELLRGIFKKDMEVRVRPGYFPFVEPGVELDIKCTICGGSGCQGCKHSGWLELLPAGLVHPNVLRQGGIDTERYSGFAFGLGLSRLAMMKYGINDIRLFNSGDLRFLRQF